MSAASTSTCATDLIISEYVEGSANNKYLELYNGTTASIDLSNYKLKLYANGSSTVTQDITLSGTIPVNGTAVFKNSAATIYTGTATNCSATNFNGNDAVALVKIVKQCYGLHALLNILDVNMWNSKVQKCCCNVDHNQR